MIHRLTIMDKEQKFQHVPIGSLYGQIISCQGAIAAPDICILAMRNARTTQLRIANFIRTGLIPAYHLAIKCIIVSRGW